MLSRGCLRRRVAGLRFGFSRLAHLVRLFLQMCRRCRTALACDVSDQWCSHDIDLGQRLALPYRNVGVGLCGLCGLVGDWIGLVLLVRIGRGCLLMLVWHGVVRLSP